MGMAAKREKDVSLFELASAKLSDAQKHMAEARDLLKQELTQARPKQCKTRKTSHQRDHKSHE